jgi:hypothetical protein
MDGADAGPTGAEEDTEDRALLTLVLDDPARQPWSLGELERELGSRVVAGDAVRRLHGAGLLHQLREGYVFPSRAAVRAYELLAR